MSAPRKFAILGFAALTMVATLSGLPAPAIAGPTYTFWTSTGVQPSDVGTITLTQIDGTTVDVLVDLTDTTLPLPRYGFLNSGGPHTPFAFTIAGTETNVSATFLQPSSGVFNFGLLSLEHEWRQRHAIRGFWHRYRQFSG